MSKLNSQVRLYFDEREKLGSAEDYWHFFFGYYLPLMDYFLSAEKEGGTIKQYQFLLNNCGP